MPDHVHAVLSFARDKSMSEVNRDRKRFHKRTNHVMWQEGYFDHRLRLDERGMQFSAKLHYIRHNPVVAGLCARAKTGLGLSIHTGSKVDRLVPKTMGFDSPKAQKSGRMNSRCNNAFEDNAFHLEASRWAQIYGDRAAFLSQRVEDNAFHLWRPNAFEQFPTFTVEICLGILKLRFRALTPCPDRHA